MLAIKSKVMRRLLPLYAAAFLQGFVFWYAIEKLFMRSIGFDDASIGVMVAAYAAIMLLVETPSGILADRWSRKGVLVLASIALVLSGLVCGLSNGLFVYVIGAMLWGVFFAMYSGTYDSIVYDTLLEETGSADHYERYYGRVQIMDGVGLTLGSLLGGVIGDALGLRSAYLAAVPFGLLSIVALLKFREPQLHKAEVAVPIKEHVTATFRSILQNKKLIPIAALLAITYILSQTVFEFNQLWLIAVALPAILFGPANALLLSTTALGGHAASRFKMHKPGVMITATFVVLTGLLVLALARNRGLIVAAQTVLGICLVGLTVVFTKLLHDALPSKVRAGAASAVGTMSSVIFIPLSLVFGYVSREQSIFHATWLPFVLAVVAIPFVLKTIAIRKTVPVTAGDELVVEAYRK